MVVAGAVITGVPTAPPLQASQWLQPQSPPMGSSQGAHSLRRPKQPPQPPQGFPRPQHPSVALVNAASVVTIRNFFMTELSNAKQSREEGDLLRVEQLYTTPRDVQTQHADFFSQPDCFF